MTNDGGVVSTAASKATTITNLELHVAHDSSLRHLTHRQNVANANLSLLTAIHGLTGVHTLSSEEQLLIDLIVITRGLEHRDSNREVRVAEGDTSERSTTTRIVDNLSDNSLDVSLALGEVQSTELRNSLAQVSVSHEDSSLGSLTLTYTKGEHEISSNSTFPQPLNEFNSELLE